MRRSVPWLLAAALVAGALVLAFLGPAFLSGNSADDDSATDASFVPPDAAQRDRLLTVFLLEKAVYELGYELNNRPEWVRIPILGISQLLRNEAEKWPS